MNLFLYFILVFILNFNKSYGKNIGKCGYESCAQTDPHKINVHLIPHSHDDVGWLQTVDQYFYGSDRAVQKILDSVVNALLKDQRRKFIYVETTYFWKWWQERNDTIHERVRYLVNNGQLEFAGGALSMNDEAVTNYQSTIDQFTWGFRKLNETLGNCARPKVAWQIDPFGHSKEMASLFSQFGFDGLFMARIDYRDKEQRLKTKSAEFVWKSCNSLGKSTYLFTSVFLGHYSPPQGFCFDIKCGSAFIHKDYKVDIFSRYVERHASHFKTNNIIVPMGDDFHYQDAERNFHNMDKLIHFMNEESENIKVFYSSPACYLKAVQEENITWSTKSDDFFPYASDSLSYWTGFYTSRPALKHFERLGNNFLQVFSNEMLLVSKQLGALSNIENTTGLNELREAMGILQHHDAITGTAKQHVTNDYASILHKAINAAETVTNKALRTLSGVPNKLEFQNCLLLNISQCHVSEINDNFLVTVYNPLSRYTTHYIRIPVSKKGYKVYDVHGLETSGQYIPIFDMIRKIPGRNSSSKYDIVFKAKNIPPLGYKIYYVKYNESNNKVQDHLIHNKFNLKFSLTGHLQSVEINNIEYSLKQNFLYYTGDSEKKSSGAYIFRPEFENATIISNNVTIQKYSGALVTEYHQKFDNFTGQIIRVYHDEEYIEFNWIVGPICTDDGNGKEIISRFTTNINNEGIFYTDTNGRGIIKRIRNHRSNYKLNSVVPVSHNYYPVTSKIMIKDKTKNLHLTVFNDRSQGGSSLNDGEIELMVHRRLVYDDGFGVGEALDETAFGEGLVVTGKHYVMLGETNNKNDLIEKELSKQILLEPWIFFTKINENINEDIKTFKQFSGLRKQLPRNIQILTLEPWNETTILLRLEHIFEQNEDKIHSKPTIINIKNLFSTFYITQIQEMNLGANQLKSEMNRFEWETEEEETNNIHKNIKSENPMEIIMYPMEIKTFIVKIKYT